MREFMLLVWQIFLIAFVQTIAEVFINPGERPYQAKVLNIACFLGSLYLLVQFIAAHLFTQLWSVINFTF